MFSLPNPAVIALLNWYEFRGCNTWYVEGEPPYVKIKSGVTQEDLTRERALGAIEAFAHERNETLDETHPALNGIRLNDPPRVGFG